MAHNSQQMALWLMCGLNSALGPCAGIPCGVGGEKLRGGQGSGAASSTTEAERGEGMSGGGGVR